MADTAVAAAAEMPQQHTGQNRNQRLKQKRKERKKVKKEQQAKNPNKKAKLSEDDTPSSDKFKQEPAGENSMQLPPGVEIEYVVANPLDDMDPNDPAYQEFASVFARFSGASEDEATEDVQMADEPEPKPVEAASSASAMSGDSDDEDGNKASNLSNRKKRQLRRLNIAALKQIVKRPDLVEIHDCSAPDPLFIIHLKGYRNSISVPKHWAQRRKYLQVRFPPSFFHRHTTIFQSPRRPATGLFPLALMCPNVFHTMRFGSKISFEI